MARESNVEIVDCDFELLQDGDKATVRPDAAVLLFDCLHAMFDGCRFDYAGLSAIHVVAKNVSQLTLENVVARGRCLVESFVDRNASCVVNASNSHFHGHNLISFHGTAAKQISANLTDCDVESRHVYQLSSDVVETTERLSFQDSRCNFRLLDRFFDSDFHDRSVLARLRKSAD